MMADQGGKSLIREYKKGNWTVSETMVLIEAKRMDDERRMKRSDSAEGRSKPTELRWKWVEDYCWKQECLRSQNQCNDKWDNLMRDYKKVRDYERKIAETGERNGGSYWKLEKNERKERNLPSNMLPQIYEELVEVVERRGGQQRMLTAAGGSGSNPNTSYVVERPITDVQPSVLPPLLQHQVSAAPTPALPIPPPCPPPSQQPQAQPPPPIQFPEPFPTVGAHTLSLPLPLFESPSMKSSSLILSFSSSRHIFFLISCVLSCTKEDILLLSYRIAFSFITAVLAKTQQEFE